MQTYKIFTFLYKKEEYSDLSNNRTGTTIYFQKKSSLYGLIRGDLHAY